MGEVPPLLREQLVNFSGNARRHRERLRGVVRLREGCGSGEWSGSAGSVSAEGLDEALIQSLPVSTRMSTTTRMIPSMVEAFARHPPHRPPVVLRIDRLSSGFAPRPPTPSDATFAPLTPGAPSWRVPGRPHTKPTRHPTDHALLRSGDPHRGTCSNRVVRPALMSISCGSQCRSGRLRRQGHGGSLLLAIDRDPIAAGTLGLIQRRVDALNARRQPRLRA